MMLNDVHGDLEGRSGAVLAVTVCMAGLATLFVFFRILSRAAIVKHISPDDYIMIVAWIIALGLSATLCYACAWGLGRKEADVPPSWEWNLKKADYAFTILYQPALMSLKTSILAFYLSFSTTQRLFKWACIATLLVVNAGGFALTIVTVFQCKPVWAIYAPITPTNASCTDILTIYISSAPLNLITDTAILFLPMPILTSMRLPRKQKIILVVTFSFGIFVAAVDVVRLAYLQSASGTRLAEIAAQTHGSSRSREQTDFTWYLSFSFMWSAIEVNVGIMCACVPGLKPLVSRFLPILLRGPEDLGSKPRSTSAQGNNNDIIAAMTHIQRVPSAPEEIRIPPEVHHHDFGSQSHAPDADDDGPMGLMDFLTTPEMNELPNNLQRTQTALTNTTRHTRPITPTVFDFVNMRGKRCMLHMTNRESVFPIAMVTIVFFIWGFEYGLLDVLNAQFQSVAHMGWGQATSIHSAYFAGYFVGPLTSGRLVLRRWGFKFCYCVGLSIFACGTLIYWPAAVLTSFPAFVITNFIVGFGLSNLEVAANPFVALCGPAQYMETRLNLSQAIQAVGSIVAPLIADKAFFHKRFDAPSLVSTQWAYLGIALATILLAVLFYYVPLPEATDEELEDASERMDGANQAKVGRFRIIWISLSFAVFSQWCYVGGQEVNGTTFNAYLGAVAPKLNQANYLAVAHTAFAASRFLAAGMSIWIKPRLLLLAFYLGAIIFQVLSMTYGGKTGVAMIIMVFFFEGPLFSLIFAQALRGMGRHTKMASVYVTASISGGAVFSPISNYVASVEGRVKYSLVLAVATFAAGTLFALESNLLPQARAQMDPIKDVTSLQGSRPSSTSSSTASRALSFLSFGKKDRRRSTPKAEWRERKPEETEVK